MPRPLRVQYPGAWHHVINRGASRRPIFQDQFDRRRFLKLLSESVRDFDIEVHAYCLMGNHYHLLVRTPSPNLDGAVHHFASHYVRWYNQRHGFDGPMFRSRYTSILIQDEKYLVGVSRYIHRNPIAFGVPDLASYHWSSLGAYVGDRRRPQWLTTREILRRTGGAGAYEAFVGGPFDGEIERLMQRKRLPPTLGEATQIRTEDAS